MAINDTETTGRYNAPMSKVRLFLSGFCLVILGININAAEEVIRLSEPVEATDHYEVFGAVFDHDATAMSLADVMARSDLYSGKELHVRTRIDQVCAKKGCFFIASHGEGNVRITFKDYGFFIPTDSSGKTVTLAGEFTGTTLTQAQARHYAADAGLDPMAIVGPQTEYSIVASSVKIEK